MTHCYNKKSEPKDITVLQPVAPLTIASCIVVNTLTETEDKFSGERHVELHVDCEGSDGEAGIQFGETGVVGAEDAEDAGAEHAVRETTQHVGAIRGQVLRLV